MRNIARLTLWELKRFDRYGILPVSLATSLLWVVIFYFVKKQEALSLAPLFVFADSTLMAMVLLGASYHLEKQERTIHSVMMMPVLEIEVLLSKIAASVVMGLQSALAVVLGLYWIHDIRIDYASLFLFVVLVVFCHSAIALALSLLSRDFSALLGWMMTFLIVFAMPSILYKLKIIPSSYERLLWFSPPHCAYELLTCAIQMRVDFFSSVFMSLYLMVVALIVLGVFVYPKFKESLTRG